MSDTPLGKDRCQNFCSGQIFYVKGSHKRLQTPVSYRIYLKNEVCNDVHIVCLNQQLLELINLYQFIMNHVSLALGGIRGPRAA